MLAHRPGAFERIGWLIEDWDTARDKLLRTEQRMVAVLNELGLTDLVCSIKGLSAVGPAAILAETGDLPRFHQRPSRGNARRTRPAGTDVGHLHWTCPPDRRRPAWAADRGLAGRVGRATRQPHVRGPAIGT